MTEAIEPTATQDNTNEPSATENTGLMGGEAEPTNEPTPDPVKEPDADPQSEPEAIPESYETFTLAEGYEMSETEHQEFSEVAKDLGLTKEKAQKLVDFDIKRSKAIAEANETNKAEADKVAKEDTIKEWTAEVQKEYGDKYSEEVGIAGKAFKTFAPAELQTILNETGLNFNPHVVKMFNAIGKAISEDSLVKGNSSKNATQTEFNTYSELLPQPNLDKNGVKRK